MPRAIWTGAISFGLVTVPVKLYSATESHDVSFHQFQEGTGERIRYKRVAEGSGEEVDYSDIVKGYEIEKGRYVIVSREELAAVEPTRSRTIEIADFVDLSEVDPMYWEKTYYLGPAPDVGAEKPYALLHKAMVDTGKVAVATFVMRTKQYLATIRPVGPALALETMLFADEIRDVEAIDNLPGDIELSDRELGIAEQLIESLSTEWEPGRYRDTYTERVLALIEAKAEGEEVVVEPGEEPAPVADLMAALQASVDAAKQRRESAAKAAGDGHAHGARHDALAAKSKEELYDMAKRQGVSGRSKMDKDELVEALEDVAS